MPDVRTKPDLSTTESDLKALAAAANNLNNLTDKLTEQVTQIESVINTLNLGLKVSVIVSSYGEEEEPWASHDVRLCYNKVDGKWGFEIEEFDTDEQYAAGRYLNYHSWAFRDAPRSLRLEVVHRIPELIKAMVKEAEQVTSRFAEKLEDAKSIASTVFKPALDAPVKK